MSKFIASNLFSFDSEYFCFDCLAEDLKVLDSDLNATVKSGVRVVSLGYATKKEIVCSICDCEPAESEQQSPEKEEQKVDKDIMKALNLDAVKIETSNVMPKALLQQETSEIETESVNAIEHLKLGKKQIALLQSNSDDLNEIDLSLQNELKQLISVTEEKLAEKAKNKEVVSLQQQITSDLSGRKSMQKEIAIAINVTEKPVFVNGIMGVKIINNNKPQRRSAASLFDI